MSIFDLFKPKWQHTKPSVRLKAVASLEDQSRLRQLALTDLDSAVRCAAISRLKDQGDLAGIARDDLDISAAQTALRRLSEDQLLKTVALDAKIPGIRAEAAGKVTGAAVVLEVVKSSQEEGVRVIAIRRLRRESAEVLDLALHEANDTLASTATALLDRLPTLEQVSTRAMSGKARATAGARIKEIEMKAGSLALSGKETLLKAAWEPNMSRSRRRQIYESAELDLRSALELDPRCFQALLGIGQIFAKRDEKYTEAISYYDRAISVNSSDPEVWMLKAASLGDGGKLQEALVCMDAAIERCNDPAGLRDLRGVREGIERACRKS